MNANQFRTADGREWAVSLTVGKAKKIKAATGVDVLKLFENKAAGLDNFFGDICLCVDALWAAVEGQHKDVTAEQFGESLTGDSIESALAAFLEGLVDFFPNAKGRDTLRKLNQATKNVQAKMADRAALALQGIDLEQMVEDAVTAHLSPPALPSATG